MIQSAPNKDLSLKGVLKAERYYGMAEVNLRNLLQPSLHLYYSHIAVWLLMSAGRASVYLECLRFFFDLLPEGGMSLLVDRFQEIFQMLTWNLAEPHIDSAVSRASLGLRIFANLLADSRRLDLSKTFSLARMQQAARDISAPLHLLIGEISPVHAATIGAWRSSPSSTGRHPRAAMATSGKVESSTILPIPERIAELAEVSFLLIRSSVAQLSSATACPSDSQFASLRNSSSLLCMPLDVLLQRYLLMLLSMLSSTLSKATEPVHVKASALLVLQRLLVRVGGQDKLDKHVPSIMALLKLAQTSPALIVPACAVWESFVHLLSKQTLKAYLSSIVVTLSTIAEQRDEWAPLWLQTQANRNLATSRGTQRAHLTWVHPQLLADCDKKVSADLSRWRDSSGLLRVVLKSTEQGYSFDSTGAPIPPSHGSAVSTQRAQLPAGPISSADAGYRRALSISVSASVIIERILTYLLVERRDDLQGAIADLPGISLLSPLRPFLKVCTVGESYANSGPNTLVFVNTGSSRFRSEGQGAPFSGGRICKRK